MPLLRILYSTASISTPFKSISFRRFSSSITMASLQLHNSLQPGGPVPFVPKEDGKVDWYVCGPTVYDKSHLGHARNYVTSDIIRRILTHHFGYKVNYVMNMTDVDDKVITAAYTSI